jgi:hypothetical protein
MSQHQEIAKTIIGQINAAGPAFPRITQMAGAKDFVFLNDKSIINDGEYIRGGVMFRVTAKKGYKVIVELTAMDTYNVQIGRVWGADYKVKASHEDIYCDQLGVIVAEDLGIV